ncbi:Hypothetical Protein FCC1311_118092, partial [Hondaea fermentalgiana]
AASGASKKVTLSAPRKSRRSAASDATQAIQRQHRESQALETEFLVSELDGCFTPKAKPKARQVYAAFGWSEGVLGSIGAESKRTDPNALHELSDKNWEVMIRTLMKAFDRLAEIICPADPAELKRRTRAKLDGEVPRHNLARDLVGILQRAPRTNVDSRAVRAILCKEVTLKDIRAFLPADSKLRLNPRTYTKARNDFKVLQDGGSLVPAHIRRSRF